MLLKGIFRVSLASDVPMSMINGGGVSRLPLPSFSSSPNRAGVRPCIFAISRMVVSPNFLPEDHPLTAPKFIWRRFLSRTAAGF